MRNARGLTLLAVADGVGGQAAGEAASAAAVETLAERFYATLANGDARAALAAAIRDANDAVLRGGAARGDNAATTLVACAVRGREAIVANLGDSRAYLVRRRVARQLTDDHSGLLPNQITRFVGDERGVQADVFVETLRAGDRLVLCSDGLTRHVSDEEIATASRGEPLAAAGALVDLALQRGGEDNVTVVVYAAGSGLARYAIAGLALLAVVAALTILGVLAFSSWLVPPTVR